MQFIQGVMLQYFRYSIIPGSSRTSAKGHTRNTATPNGDRENSLHKPEPPAVNNAVLATEGVRFFGLLDRERPGVMG
jgi:hypothetical protein